MRRLSLKELGDMYSDDEEAKEELGERDYALYNKHRLELEEENDNYVKESLPKLQAIVNAGLFEHVEVNHKRKKVDADLLKAIAKTKGKANFAVTL